jgi:FkbM family methyltransferase
LYKFINWYIKRFPFPFHGWKYFRSILQRAGIYNKDYIKRLHNGCHMYVNPSEHVQQSIFWYGYYEKEAVLTWEAFIGNGAIVIDIGAHTGYYSLVAAPRAKTVIAFEPSPAIAARLKANVALNDFTNIITVTAAISDQEGIVSLYVSSNDNSGMTGLQPAENFSGTIEKVPAFRLDSWIASNDLPGVNCIKLDVEGAELKALSGMRQALLTHHPVLFIEVIGTMLQKFNTGARNVFSFMNELGYEGYHVKAPRVLQKTSSPAEAYTIVFLHRDQQIPRAITVLEQS